MDKDASGEIQFKFSQPSTPGTPKAGKANSQTDSGEIYNIVREALKPLQTQLITANEEISALRQDLAAIRQDNEILKEDVTKLQGYNRKDNLKLLGLRELPYENRRDCKRLVLNLLLQANIKLHPKSIETANRIGRKFDNRPRPMLIKVFHAEEREFLLAKSLHIYRTTGIRIEEDFPPVIEYKRKQLKPILFAANKSKDHNYTASLNHDKLIIDNKQYSVENLDTLPPNLNPERIFTPTDGSTTAFFTFNSPLSNHHLANQRVNNQLFNSNEQYYMYMKCKTFNDHETAEKIMKEKRPGLQKKLGDDIKVANFNKTVWRDRCNDIMSTGLRAKFDQNPKLKQFLMNTNNTFLVEASPKDFYWGAGLSLRDPKLWQRNTWVGKASNHMGRLLSELRRDYNRLT